jgi:hypothetical protein
MDYEGPDPIPLDDPCPQHSKIAVDKMNLFINDAKLYKEDEPDWIKLNWKRLLNVRDVLGTNYRQFRYSDQQLEYHYTKNRQILESLMQRP